MYGTTIIIYGVIAIIVCIVFGAVTANLAKEKGYSYGAFFAVGFFLCVIGLIIVLVIEDKNKNASESEAADSLLRYKLLMDEGVITEEEFNNKKSALLKNDAKEERSIGEPPSVVANNRKRNGLQIASIALAATAGTVSLMGVFSLIDLWIQDGDFFFVFQRTLLNLLSYVVCIVAAVVCIFSAYKRLKQLAIIAVALSALAVLLALGDVADLINVYGVTVMTYISTLLYPILLVVSSALAMKS